MLHLTLRRFHYDEHRTIGELLLNGEHECWTLEDRVRDPGVKVPGETAIPCGGYDVVIDMSARFKRLMPQLLDVPNFAGVRIHCGNTERDTEGCILVGHTYSNRGLENSRLAFDRLFPKLQAAEPEGIRLTIMNDKELAPCVYDPEIGL